MKTYATVIFLISATLCGAEGNPIDLKEPYRSQLVHAYKLYYQSNDAAGSVTIYTNLLCAPIPIYHKLNILNKLGDWSKANTNYLEAIERYTQILDYPDNHGPIESNFLKGYNHNAHNSSIKIAQCYEALGDLSNAIQFTEKAISYPASRFCGMDRSPNVVASNYLDRLIRKQIDHQSVPGYPPQGVGSADP
ncbi:MAG: hypothetical protein EOM72_10560 [Opitutae bacterium]|nr:hypothetical protein [Opitutae bacterium]